MCRRSIPWKFGETGSPVESLSDMPDNTFGIVYLIETEKGNKYIGKKQVVSVRKKKFGKRKIAAMTDKRI